MPMSANRRRDLAAATVVLLLAAVLRFSGLAYGQPVPEYTPEDAPLNTIHDNTPVHPDEFLFVQRPLRMLLTGQYNPKFFHNPSFLINTNLVVYWLTGEQNRLSWEGRDEIGARRAAPFRLYLNGRTFSALGGILAVAATFAAARRLTNRYGAAVAGGVVAVSLPMVQHAHYTTTSSLAAGFAMVCVWASLAALRGFRWWLFALAGVAAGLAAGSRYNAAAVSIVVFVVGLVLLYRVRTVRRAAWVLLGYVLFPAVFVFTTPHVIFDTAFFWSEFQSITNQYIGSGDALWNTSPWVGLWYELNYMALFGLGLPAAAMTVWGVWGGLWRGHTRLAVAALLAYLLPYAYVVLRTIRPLGADQMLVPVIPALALLAGIGAGALVIRRRVLAALVYAALLLMPLTASAAVVWQFTQPDTRTVAQGWVFDHIAPGAAFHLIGPYNVPLDRTLYTFTQTFGTQDIPTVDAMRADGVDYVIVSDAWLFQFERAGFVPPDALADLRGQLPQTLEALATFSRSWIVGTRHPMHSATYWHHPQITIYCLEACEN